jgi:hypothetical protein
MIGRPTTEQLALDCARELTNQVLPAVDDPTAVRTVQMLENVLRNIAVRAAHEVAWMVEETATIEQYAREVAERFGGDGIAAGLVALAAAPRDSLHLEDVAETYARAGDLLSAATDVALASDDDALARRAYEILRVRCDREVTAMAEWSPVAR